MKDFKIFTDNIEHEAIEQINLLQEMSQLEKVLLIMKKY